MNYPRPELQYLEKRIQDPDPHSLNSCVAIEYFQKYRDAADKMPERGTMIDRLSDFYPELESGGLVHYLIRNCAGVGDIARLGEYCRTIGADDMEAALTALADYFSRENIPTEGPGWHQRLEDLDESPAAGFAAVCEVCEQHAESLAARLKEYILSNYETILRELE